MRIGDLKTKAKKGIESFFEQIIRYPREAIEFVLATTLFIIAIYTMIPNEWQSTSSIYGTDLSKLIVGALLLWPSLPVLYWRIRYGIQDYIYKFQKKRRTRLFLISTVYTYLIALSIQISSVWPPHWAIYVGLAAVSWIEYLRLGG